MSIQSLSDGDLRFAAMAAAAIAHNGQTYDDGAFVNHLLDVASVAEEFGLASPHMVAGCLLHDIVEDTSVTVDELGELFPKSIVDIVWCVTDSTEGKNRAERKANTYAKTASNRAAVALKLCDRISNVRASVLLMEREPDGKNFIAMYQKEHAAFREALYREGEYEGMWQVLDDLLEQPEHCVMCENEGGPLSVESGGVVTEHDKCPTCTRAAA